MDPPARLVGDDLLVPCVDGTERRYVNLDSAASTSAFPSVMAAVEQFVPMYSSVHRGRGTSPASPPRPTSRPGPPPSPSPAAEGAATATSPSCAATPPRPSTSSPTGCASSPTTWCSPPWSSITPTCCPGDAWPPDATSSAGRTGPSTPTPSSPGSTRRRGRACSPSRAPPTSRDGSRRWPTSSTAAHDRGVPVVLDAAQLAPHRPIPADADFVAFSGHKLYAPFGAGVLVGPGRHLRRGRPLPGRRGGGRPRRPRRGVVDRAPRTRGGGLAQRHGRGGPRSGARGARPHRLGRRSTDPRTARWPRGSGTGSPPSTACGCSGPRSTPTPSPSPPSWSKGVDHALVAARLSAEWGIGVRHGCFCAHPYLIRLLGLVARRRRRLPGAGAGGRPPLHARSGAGQLRDLEHRVRRRRPARRGRTIAGGAQAGEAPPVPYVQDVDTGDYWPVSDEPGWRGHERETGASCARG